MPPAGRSRMTRTGSGPQSLPHAGGTNVGPNPSSGRPALGRFGATLPSRALPDLVPAPPGSFQAPLQPLQNPARPRTSPSKALSDPPPEVGQAPRQPVQGSSRHHSSPSSPYNPCSNPPGAFPNPVQPFSYPYQAPDPVPGPSRPPTQTPFQALPPPPARPRPFQAPLQPSRYIGAHLRDVQD